MIFSLAPRKPTGTIIGLLDDREAAWVWKKGLEPQRTHEHRGAALWLYNGLGLMTTAFTTISELSQRLRRREVSSVEITQDCLVRIDRKSTRLNSSHLVISSAVFCLKKKNTTKSTVAIGQTVDTSAPTDTTHTLA